MTGRTDLVHTVKLSQVQERKVQALMDLSGLDNFSEYIRRLIDEEAKRVVDTSKTKAGKEARRILAMIHFAG